MISLRSRAERNGGLDTEKREIEREMARGRGVGWKKTEREKETF